MDNVFSIFEDAGLGLFRDNKVRLVSHNQKWGDVFEFESKRIAEALNIKSLKLHHCGSTSLANIVAKPVLDIVGEVECLSELDQREQLLVDIGYECKGEYGIVGRRYSVLYNSDKTVGYCHLHIFKAGSEELLDHLIFRDYLLENDEAAKRYEIVKKSLNVPRSEYSNGKTQIILELLHEAKAQLGINKSRGQ